MFGTLTRVKVLAVADRESVSEYGGKIMASPGSSVGGLSACGTRPGASGYDSPVFRMVYRLLDWVYWPGLCQDVRSYLASCAVCLARKSPCPRRAPMGHVDVGHDCFSRWTEACPLPDKTALAVADAFCQHIVCRFGMPSVIHSDQGQEFENKVMQKLCLLCGAHKTRKTPYHPESDGLEERFIELCL